MFPCEDALVGGNDRQFMPARTSDSLPVCRIAMKGFRQVVSLQQCRHNETCVFAPELFFHDAHLLSFRRGGCGRNKVLEQPILGGFPRCGCPFNQDVASIQAGPEQAEEARWIIAEAVRFSATR